MKCRHCSNVLKHNFLDLGFAPPSNAFLTEEQLNRPEKYYPLRVMVCDQCWLVQTEDLANNLELFGPDYAYFSSTSSGWLEHAAEYSEMIMARLGLNGDSFVIEVASNDGYLLRNFLHAGIPCLGIEPTAGTADVAEQMGIPVIQEFFGELLGQRLFDESRQADLIVGNNVFAHVPDVNDFTRGLKAALKPSGVISLEFPHLLRLIEQNQFDTVYHEHYSYFSLLSVQRIFEAHQLRIWDIDELPTHGGSLRVYGVHDKDSRSSTEKVANLLSLENERGLRNMATYSGFQSRADRVKNDFLRYLIEQRDAGRSVAAYGAAAKGNTLLNYAGIKPDLLPFVCDAALAKQNKYLPGSHIPIHAPKVLWDQPPDELLILPWNIADEIKTQLSDLARQGMKFVTAVPSLKSV